MHDFKMSLFNASVSVAITESYDLAAQVVRSRPAEDLWVKAAKALGDNDKLPIDLNQAERLKVLDDVLAAVEEKKRSCLQKRWKYKNSKGEEVILRNVLAKIVVWVDKFKEVGDIAVQYDPMHAALPWAAVRLVLQMTVNDSQTFGAMAEGVEFVSNLITRYTILEQLYLQRPSAAKDQLTQAILRLYSSVLEYLSRANSYYQKNTFERAAKSVMQTPVRGVDQYINKIKAEQANADECTRLIAAELLENMNDRVQNIQGDLADVTIHHTKLEMLLTSLDKPIGRMATQLSDLHDSLGDSERGKVFEWLSNVKYMTHHRIKTRALLPGSCQWLFEKQQFQEWRNSDVSSILWLHGIPGSGKSMLVSALIEQLVHETPANERHVPVAFFYCVRNTAEPERANPDEILRSILKQLSSTEPDLRIRKPVVEAYNEKMKEARGSNPEKLMLDEIVQVILSLLETNPANIVIDALDECDPDRRHELFEALDTIIQESASLVKVFVSSRDDGDIICRLTSSPNIFIRTSDNKEDIKCFARTEVAQAIQKKRLINGNVSRELEERIIKTLIDGAHGMFRWVSLQIQSLCNWRRIKTEEQINQELGRLPETLKESYDLIYQTLSDSGLENKMLAEKVMKWLICAQRSLYSHELIAAISVDSGRISLKLCNNVLLDICCNMVVLDSEQNVFRFAHLSVREYLEGRGDYTLFATHSLALDRCLDLLTFEPILTTAESTVEQNSIFQKYANIYWPVHCQTVESNQMAEGLRQKLRKFIFQGCNISHLYTKWLHAVPRRNSYLWSDPTLRVSQDVISSPPNPIFLACSFGLVLIIEDLGSLESIDWNQKNSEDETGLHLASINGHEAVVKLLLEAKADVSIKDRLGNTALVLAAHHGHEGIVKLLLEAKADVDVKDTYGNTALVFAAHNGHEGIVKLLLEAKADVDVKDTYGKTALVFAARNGHEGVVKLLLEGKADVDVKDTYGETALVLAARNGHEAVVKLLLEAKADVNVKDTDGETALVLAAQNGHEAVVKLLLEAKADINIAGRDGDTALERAFIRGHEAVVKLLRVGSR